MSPGKRCDRCDRLFIASRGEPVRMEGERLCEPCATGECRARAEDALTDPSTGRRYAWTPRLALVALVALVGCAPTWTDARQADAERAYTCDPAGSWPEGPPAWRYPCERTDR